MSYKILTTSECDVAQVFSAPSSAGAYVAIGNQQLVPSPFLNLTLEKYTTGDIVTGGLLRVQLAGTVVGASFDQVAADGNGPAQSIKTVLELAANSDCITLEIKCGSDFIKGKGKIVSFSASEGNQPSWVNYAPYTVDIELYSNLLDGGKPYVKTEGAGLNSDINDLLIKDLSEEFTVDINENSFLWDTVPGASNSLKGVGDRHIKASFSIGAAGLGSSCPSASGVKQGLDAVEQYMIRRLEKLKNMDLSGLDNKPNTEIIPAFDDYRGESFLDFRSISVNPIENRMSISGEIIYRPSGCHSDVFSSLTVEENLANDGNNITISGNIRGLVDSKYNTIIKNTTYLDSGCNFNEKMAHANAFFGIIRPELEDIAKAHASSSNGNPDLVLDYGENYIKDICPPASGNTGDVCYPPPSGQSDPDFCNLRLVSSQISRNYGSGEINFTYTYNNNPNCSVPGARTIEIEATHDMPRDNIVEIVVPGRGQKGVLTQNLCVLSSEKWSLSFNATLISSSCGRPKEGMDLTILRDCAKNELEDFKNDNGIDTDCWFITDRQETLGNKTYRYNIQYTKPSCP